MQAKFISHPDFAALEPIYIYHKQHDNPPYSHPAELINKHIIYRRKAVLGGFQKATLKISADDYYKLYVNGKYVTEGPASAYHTHYFYNEFDLTDYLAEGENTFAVHTFYQGLIGNGCVSGDLRQMLWLELALDGQTVLVSDESWKCKYHTGYIEIGRYGYDTAIAASGGAQAAGVITGIKVLCVLLPAIFSLGSWAAFKYVWNITPEVRKEVAAYHENKKASN